MEYRGKNIDVIQAYKNLNWMADFGMNHSFEELDAFTKELKEKIGFKQGDEHPHNKILAGYFD